MIKTTISECLDAAMPLRKLSAVEGLPQKTIYKLAQLLENVQVALTRYHKQRNELVKRHGTERQATAKEIAEGSPATVVDVTPANREAFYAADENLKTADVEITGYPLTQAELAAVTTLTAGDVVNLRRFTERPPDDDMHDETT